MDTSYITNVKTLLEEFLCKNEGFFDKQTIDCFIGYLDCIARNESYRFISNYVIKTVSSSKQIGGEESLAGFNKCVLLRLIEQFSDRITISDDKFPDSIISQLYSI